MDADLITQDRFKRALDCLTYETKHGDAEEAGQGTTPSGAGGGGAAPPSGSSSGPAKAAGKPGAGKKCRPWDRGDFLYRLGSFKASTWFGKPRKVGAIACARRGWMNVGIDTIQCEACTAKAMFPVPPEWSATDAEEAAEKFFKHLDDSHHELCPWIGNACSVSMVQFPVLPASEALDSYEKRCTALARLDHLPELAMDIASKLDPADRESLQRLVEKGPTKPVTEGESRGGGVGVAATPVTPFVRAQRTIALFGWIPRTLSYRVEGQAFAGAKLKVSPVRPGSQQKESAVLQCELCGACAGLWGYRKGPEPPPALRLIAKAAASGASALPGDGIFRTPQPAHRTGLGGTVRGVVSPPRWLPNPTPGANATPPSAVRPGTAGSAGGVTPSPTSRLSPACSLGLSIAGGPSPQSGGGIPRMVFGGTPPPPFGSPPAAAAAATIPSPADALAAAAPGAVTPVAAPAAQGKRKVGDDDAGAGDKRARVATASPAAGGEGASAAAPGVAGAGLLSFHPLLEHRPFCPWVNANNDEGGGDHRSGVAEDAAESPSAGGGARQGGGRRQCGWRVYLEALSPDENEEPPTEQEAFERMISKPRPNAAGLVRQMLG